ncbi:threonine ammonia-lyase IlvA [Patescibacteria group bacterium]|nr:threonine ammonia-lyase IlvA [Patescibacteria group bacterium]
MPVSAREIEKAAEKLANVVAVTPLQFNKRLSDEYGAEIYLKREDLQEVRSYKIRGAYNKMLSLSAMEVKKGVVTASAGNHAQGVALSCKKMKVKGTVFMPTVTPGQKIERVKYFGDGFVQIKLVGQTYDESTMAAKEFAKQTDGLYISAFDDEKVIAGQGTVGKEIYDELSGKVDVVLAPVGGGGLISGVASYLKDKADDVKIVGVEAKGADCMDQSLKNKKVVSLETIDTFCDGCAVKTPGRLTLRICQELVDRMLIIDTGAVAQRMIELFQNEGIITEPAGALSVAALDELKGDIRGKRVVCIISGGNNDLLRYPEIMERSLVYQGRKHYFLIEFAQKPGQLKKFVNHVLGPRDDVVLFEYVKRTNREKGPVLVGVEFSKKEDYLPMVHKMNDMDFNFKELRQDDLSYNFLI